MLTKTVTNEECIEANWKTVENIPLRCNVVPERTKIQTEIGNNNPDVKFPRKEISCPIRDPHCGYSKEVVALKEGRQLSQKLVSFSRHLLELRILPGATLLQKGQHILPFVVLFRVAVLVQLRSNSGAWRFPGFHGATTEIAYVTFKWDTKFGVCQHCPWRNFEAWLEIHSDPFFSRLRGCRGNLCEYSRWKPSRW